MQALKCYAMSECGEGKFLLICSIQYKHLISMIWRYIYENYTVDNTVGIFGKKWDTKTKLKVETKHNSLHLTSDR